jgi:t-SNARE complex subunit (syntaxin)
MKDFEQIEKDVDMLKESMLYLNELASKQSEDIDTLEDHIQTSKKELSAGVEEVEEQQSYPYYKYAIIAVGLLWFVL